MTIMRIDIDGVPDGVWGGISYSDSLCFFKMVSLHFGIGFTVKFPVLYPFA